MQIRNKTEQARAIDLDGGTIVVEPGDTADVPDELATGTPATGEEGSPEYRAGTSGLLAQEDVWERATRKQKTDDAPADGEEG